MRDSSIFIFLLQVETKSICVFIISTYIDGTPPDKAKWFCKYLKEASDDFRVQKSLLNGLQYTVFGLGNSVYEDNYNKVSIFFCCANQLTGFYMWTTLAFNGWTCYGLFCKKNGQWEFSVI